MLELFNYCLVTLFGFFLSAEFAGGWRTNRQRNALLALSILLLAVQGLAWMAFDVETVRKIYPLIIHLPLVLILVFLLKRPVTVALVCVFTAYLCCQLPRWVELAVAALTRSSLVGEIFYTAALVGIYLLLHRHFAKTVHEAMSRSRSVLLLFGGLPFVYYLFDYTAAVYSDVLYSGISALDEFIPTALADFFIAFLTAYHTQAQKQAQAELEKNLLHAQLKQSGLELQALRHTESQTAIYQHNMRHHLTAIEGFLAAGSTAQAREYIRKVHEDIGAITPQPICANELVNLLCASFLHQAEEQDIRFTVDARPPRDLAVSDTELCAILSNGLENALNAVKALPVQERLIRFSCEIRQNTLLNQFVNPYQGEIRIENGLPISTGSELRYGCRSILAIVQRRNGPHPRHL